MKITHLYIYPIKSLRPVSVPRTRLRREGLEHDRRFMLLKVLDDGTYKNIQTAYFPECTLFHQAIVPALSSSSPSSSASSGPGSPGSQVKDEEGEEEKEKEIVVTYQIPPKPFIDPPPPEQSTSLRVPLRPSTAGLETVTVTLMDSATTVYRMGEPYDAWFSACMGYPTLLVYIGDGRRDVLAHSPQQSQQTRGQAAQKKSWLSSITSYISGAPAPGEKGRGDKDWLAFNEAAPFLVTSLASLRDVSARLPEGVDMDMVRFRPNIVVGDDDTPPNRGVPPKEEDRQGLQPWEEDFWAELAVGPARRDGGEGEEEEEEDEEGEGDRRRRLALTANCARCVSINLDYDTGRPAEGEAGSVLKKLMKDRRVDSGSRWSPIFGRYAFLLPPSLPSTEAEDVPAEVGVGDEVTVTRRIADRDVWRWPSK
ncbi:MOSC domain-containing protein [Xylariomycetidae sp. FL2044]|nr:MOSC domain-containing protein [Xylariomycetidae sp. FL2044]